MKSAGSNVQGAVMLVLAVLIFSLQDISVKWIGGDYSVIQMVTIRSLIGVPATLVLLRLEGKRGLPETRQHRLEYLRGLFLFLSYTTHFMGLASLPLADVAAIRFSVPMMITLLSVVFLDEKVGLPRWLALIVGFGGVLITIQPGSPTFNTGSIFILISTFFYAISTIITRQLRETESGATMAYYSSLVYLLGSLIMVPLPLLVGDQSNAQAGIAFLFRPWAMPGLMDMLIMCGLGLIWAIGVYCIARAYSLALASVAAPFEYVNLPISVLWGFLFWREVPTPAMWIGAFLTIASGLFILYRQQQEEAKEKMQVEVVTP